MELTTLIDLAKAYAYLGTAIQEQLDEVVNYAIDDENFNPAAAPDIQGFLERALALACDENDTELESELCAALNYLEAEGDCEGAGEGEGDEDDDADMYGNDATRATYEASERQVRDAFTAGAGYGALMTALTPPPADHNYGRSRESVLEDRRRHQGGTGLPQNLKHELGWD